MALFRDLFLMEKSERGQILLVVVLTTIVALTVGLSVASRTITNLKISKQNEESQRAFQAAEAGVEKVIQQTGNQNELCANNTCSLSNGSTFVTTITQESGSVPFLLNNREAIVQDIGQDVWLSHYSDYSSPISTRVTISWGTNTQNCSAGSGAQVLPAVEVVLLTGPSNSPGVVKKVFDPCNRISGSTVTAKLSSPVVIEGESLNYSENIDDLNKLIMKVIPLYNSAKVGIVGNMPSQGNVIESIGSSGDTQRKIVYFESYPQLPPEIFPYVIMSQ